MIRNRHTCTAPMFIQCLFVYVCRCALCTQETGWRCFNQINMIIRTVCLFVYFSVEFFFRSLRFFFSSVGVLMSQIQLHKFNSNNNEIVPKIHLNPNKNKSWEHWTSAFFLLLVSFWIHKILHGGDLSSTFFHPTLEQFCRVTGITSTRKTLLCVICHLRIQMFDFRLLYIHFILYDDGI